MRVKALILSVLAIAGLTLGLTASAPAPQASASYPCVRLFGGHNNWLCVYGGLYWTDNLFTREFYWHPYAGDQVVMEQYFCRGDQDNAYGHPICISNAPGVPASEPRWQRRVISLADGCTVYGWNVAYDDKTPPAPVHCVLPTGSERPLTSGERKSVLDFWTVMQHVGGYW